MTGATAGAFGAAAFALGDAAFAAAFGAPALGAAAALLRQVCHKRTAETLLPVDRLSTS